MTAPAQLLILPTISPAIRPPATLRLTSSGEAKRSITYDKAPKAPQAPGKLSYSRYVVMGICKAPSILRMVKLPVHRTGHGARMASNHARITLPPDLQPRDGAISHLPERLEEKCLPIIYSGRPPARRLLPIFEVRTLYFFA